MKKKQRKQSVYSLHYNHIDELMAAPDKALPVEKRDRHISAINAALENIKQHPEPTNDDWRILSDCVNLMETFTTVNRGHWLDADGDVVQIEDKDNALFDGITAMAMCGKRKQAGNQLRFSGQEVKSMETIIEAYTTVITALSERSMIRCHRLTERRIQDILRGRKQPHDVELVAM